MQNSKEKVQQDKYNFPYHYIPVYDDKIMKKVQYWGTGHRYLGNIKIIFDLLEKIEFDSLIDIGTGDGRIVRELYNKYNDKDIVGVDYYKIAIDLAKAMNPNIADRFMIEDISNKTIDTKYDVVTIINVLEQIEPDKLNNFVFLASEYLKKDGYFIITVPSDNKEVFGAAYQHFNENKLIDLLSELFYDINIIYFDDIKSKRLNLFHRLIGGFNGENYIITNRYINKKFIDLYMSKYLYTTKEKCGRIAVICRKK